MFPQHYPRQPSLLLCCLGVTLCSTGGLLQAQHSGSLLLGLQKFQGMNSNLLHVMQMSYPLYYPSGPTYHLFTAISPQEWTSSMTVRIGFLHSHLSGIRSISITLWTMNKLGPKKMQRFKKGRLRNCAKKKSSKSTDEKELKRKESH